MYALLSSIADERCPFSRLLGSAQHEYAGIGLDKKNRLFSVYWDRYLEFAFGNHKEATTFLGWAKKVLGKRWTKYND